MMRSGPRVLVSISNLTDEMSVLSLPVLPTVDDYDKIQNHVPNWQA